MLMSTLVILRFTGIFAAYTGIDSAFAGNHVPQNTERQEAVRAISDVLYIWKLLYY